MNKVKSLLLVSSLFIGSTASASVWVERNNLAHIEKEIQSLEVLIKNYENQSSLDNRTTFDYRALLSDLTKIRQGIKDHLTVPMEPVIPSTIDALDTRYTEHSE